MAEFPRFLKITPTHLNAVTRRLTFSLLLSPLCYDIVRGSREDTTVFPALPRTQRATAFNLGGDPKGKNFLYCFGQSIIIRDIENPAISDVYTQHVAKTTVAKYAPSGFYIASADEHGKVRIWDTVNKEHILKNEFQPIGGPIKDIVWSPDSKRIAICGEGKEKFAHCFLWDTGSSVGELMGISKVANSIDYRPTRPFRIIAGGDDSTTIFYEGPPFKFKMSLAEHTRFVNCVRFSPDGERFVSVGADGKGFIYDGKTADLIAELGGGGSNAHGGGIYGCSWSPDSTQLITCSGDKTVKLWDMGQNSMVSEFKMGTAIEDQQLSCLWQGDYLLSVSLNGYINYLDRSNPTTPIRIVKVVVLRNGRKVFSLPVNYEATAAGVHPNQTQVMVGGKDKKLYVYNLAGDTLVECKTIQLKGAVTAFAFSPDGRYLSCAQTSRHITTLDASAGYVDVQGTDAWMQNAMVTCVAWNPSSTHLASGSLDTNIVIWDLAKPYNRFEMKGAHPISQIVGLEWLTDNKLISVGTDNAIRQWDIKY
uniref:Uncharacterized protein n=1 Tax=Branchiostoma floridae TaxID=7739 RepID=C3YJ60_BRAFL|eukprot:XP_002603711.1 hypothetical protein BRAFLDRAFT_126885 [Branchiostoma floridae]